MVDAPLYYYDIIKLLNGGYIKRHTYLKKRGGKMELLAGIALVPTFLITIALSVVYRILLCFVGMVVPVGCVVVGPVSLLLQHGI